VTRRAENTALMEFSGEWTPLPPTDMLDEHLRGIAELIRLQIDTGVRIGQGP
jgi:hypothetical protein